MRNDGEEFIPYLVLVRFDKGDTGLLTDRLKEDVPLLQAALDDAGTVQSVMMSYDGSMVAYVVAANPRFESAHQLYSHLNSPRSKKVSSLTFADKVLVVSLETGFSTVERVRDWLSDHDLIVYR